MQPRRPDARTRSSYNEQSKHVRSRGGMCERLKQAVLKTGPCPALLCGFNDLAPPNVLLFVCNSAVWEPNVQPNVQPELTRWDHSAPDCGITQKSFDLTRSPATRLTGSPFASARALSRASSVRWLNIPFIAERRSWSKISELPPAAPITAHANWLWASHRSQPKTSCRPHSQLRAWRIR